MYSPSRKFIFIHIPKTGGSSVESVIRPFCPKDHRLHKDVHMSALRAYLHLGENTWGQLTSFTIVRNSWSRLVSAYHHYTRGKDLQDVKFEDYVYDVHYCRPYAYGHTFSQLYFITDYLQSSNWSSTKKTDHCLDPDRTRLMPSDNFLVKHILRFENLASDMSKMFAKLNITTPLPHVNPGGYKQHYTEYYTDKLEEIVYNIYKPEIDYFGYTFK